MTEIVVGVDGSEESFATLRWAAQEADLRHLTLAAVMAWGRLDQHHVTGEAAFDPGYDEHEALRVLAGYVEEALGPEAGLGHVRRRAVNDLAAPGLLSASAGAAPLLVVGARGLGGFRRLLLGSVSEQCLHHAHCPVAIVRDGETTGGARTRMVVGVDGSDVAGHALRWALEEARLCDATLDVVHVWNLPVAGGYPYAEVGVDLDFLEHQAEEVLEHALAGEDTTGIPDLRRMLECGATAPALLHAAKGADLVVLGSRGRGGFTGLLLGSVSTQVAHHLSCPLVVVPSCEPPAPEEDPS